ncbi:ankyrin repeat domain-containing protein [Roseofilum casamattae]|uniref:Ankyrin repeat domain-containing protein n=1 Tax=Roseofilum casamattae BLCC-M143 TaxID=3022442 RepID=A0ABT7C3G7_9CYAN|nr:ankyrin repeat domain-containing protein [Roseofilum casamattae]MDJ1185241.1 ankyrin repeat domain-containing protein [Roseofilum casamattae BLCC-M143]
MSIQSIWAFLRQFIALTFFILALCSIALGRFNVWVYLGCVFILIMVINFDWVWIELWEKIQYQEIHIRAENGDSQWVKEYLEQGGNSDPKTVKDITPLYLAAREGHVEVFRLLVEYGADPNHKVLDMSLDSTPIWIAMYKKHDEIIDFLLQYGVEKDVFFAIYSGDLEVLKQSIANEEDINLIRSKELSKTCLREKDLLHMAMPRDSANAVKFLLEKGADVDIQDERGFSLLHYAAINNALTVAQVLLEQGVAVDAVPSHHSLTPLHEASTGGHINAIELLLDNGAEIDAQESVTSYTPLHLAISGNFPEAVKVLISRGASVKLEDSSGRTPLAHAEHLGNRAEIIQILADREAE